MIVNARLTSHRVRVRLPILVLAVVVAGSAWVSSPPRAIAAVACAGARSNYFDGKYTNSSTTYGARAVIETFYPGLCTGGASTFSNAWSMIAPQATTGWAQSGYVKDTIMSQTTVYYFAQWKKNTAATPNTLYTSPGPANGAVIEYKSVVNSNGYIDMYRGATLMATSTWKPADFWGAQPWSNQYFGETGHCETDVPGLDFNPVSLTSVQYRSQVGGTWLTPVGLTGVHHCGSTYQYATVSSTAFNIWTYRP